MKLIKTFKRTVFVLPLILLSVKWRIEVLSQQCPGTNNDCNGHGICNLQTKVCQCYRGWGHPSDITTYRAPDCTARSCPSGKAWADVPTGPSTAHALAECSNRGYCNRITGRCECDGGFTGDACQRTKCFNDCSGHGRCLSIKQMSLLDEAQPLSISVPYGGSPDTTTWDEDKIFGCVCDSGWPVGPGANQYSVPEWFGPDCSLHRCPPGDNPDTADVNEVNQCGGQAIPGGTTAAGHLCHVECSDRGLCDYLQGVCNCFQGYYGDNCGIRNPLYTLH